MSTLINEDIKIQEGEGQSWGKLYVNDDKELYFKDSDDVEVNLSASGVQKVYSLSSTVTKTSTDTFATFNIPADSLQVGSVVSVVAQAALTAYSSGTVTIRATMDNSFLLADSETATPANGWQFYGQGSATVSALGASGSVLRGGMGIFGLPGSRGQSSNSPVIINGTNTVDTTADLSVEVICEISGSATVVLQQFFIIIAY